MTEIAPNDEYEITDDVPFLAAPSLTWRCAQAGVRAPCRILKAAEAQIRAAEHTLAAARDERCLRFP